MKQQQCGQVNNVYTNVAEIRKEGGRGAKRVQAGISFISQTCVEWRHRASLRSFKRKSKKRSSGRACFKNRSSERVRLKNRSTAMEIAVRFFKLNSSFDRFLNVQFNLIDCWFEESIFRNSKRCDWPPRHLYSAKRWSRLCWVLSPSRKGRTILLEKWNYLLPGRNLSRVGRPRIEKQDIQPKLTNLRRGMQ